MTPEGWPHHVRVQLAVREADPSSPTDLVASAADSAADLAAYGALAIARTSSLPPDQQAKLLHALERAGAAAAHAYAWLTDAERALADAEVSHG